MEYGIQNILKKIGDEGCYFLCLLKAANVPHSKIVDAYVDCLERGYIGEYCYVYNPVEILRMFGLAVSSVTKTDTATAPHVKVAIALYEYGRYTHFVLLDGDRNVWDPLGESETVKHGKIKSYRLFC